MVRKNTLFLLFTYNKILFKWKERMKCLEVLRCIIFPNKYTTVLWWTFNKFVCRNMCTCLFVRDSFVIIVVRAITLGFKKKAWLPFLELFALLLTQPTKSTNLMAIYCVPQNMSPNMYSLLVLVFCCRPCIFSKRLPTFFMFEILDGYCCSVTTISNISYLSKA